ncbi:hypothetical protein [Cyanobium sp. ATX 6A2]|uniref:hypothetical protein n=1 Tax=Cyanobium sp. ATX 6A2 TaxID=2823700 RepID=UPI0020CC1C36|nr:hypothetical protein [Cyanobium sp. ATX 6A2]
MRPLAPGPLVFRGWGGPAALDLLTDGRSAKPAELAGPEPAAPLAEPSACPQELPAETPMPEHFILLRIALEQVELLELSGHPHQRRRWRLDDSWREQRLNP